MQESNSKLRKEDHLFFSQAHLLHLPRALVKIDKKVVKIPLFIPTKNTTEDCLFLKTYLEHVALQNKNAATLNLCNNCTPN